MINRYQDILVSVEIVRQGEFSKERISREYETRRKKQANMCSVFSLTLYHPQKYVYIKFNTTIIYSIKYYILL